MAAPCMTTALLILMPEPIPITISAPAPIVQALQPLEIGIPLATSLLGTKEFAFLEYRDETVTTRAPASRTSEAGKRDDLSIDVDKRVSGDSGKASDPKSWPHPLRSSPTRSRRNSTTMQLPELKEHQALTLNDDNVPVKVMEAEPPTRLKLDTSSVVVVEQYAVPAPPVPRRSPSRPTGLMAAF